MKQISFIIIIILSVFLVKCGARQEKVTENKDSLTADTQKTTDSLQNYDDFKNEGDSLLTGTDTLNAPKVNEKTIDTKEKKTTTTKTHETKPKTTTSSKSTTTKKSTEVKVLTETKDGTLKKTTASVGANNKRFYLVGGSYTQVENAKKRESLYKSKGFKAQILPKSAKGKYFYVALSSSASKQTAKDELKRAQAKFKDFKFWILYR